MDQQNDNNYSLDDTIFTKQITINGQSFPINKLYTPNYYVSISSIHNIGLFSSKNIPIGTLIIEYVGLIVSSTYADILEKKYTKNNIDSIYMFKINDEYIVDATMFGNHSRFINHSCNPNAIAYKIKDRIFIYSVKEIKEDEEITIKYNLSDEKGKKRLKCNCLSNECREIL